MHRFPFPAPRRQTTEEVKAYLARIPDAAKPGYQTKNISKERGSEFFSPAAHRFNKLLGDMNDALADRQWLAGDDYSLANIAYTPYAVRLDHLQLQRIWTSQPCYAAWYERRKQRPTFKTAITDWINPAYLEIMVPKGTEAWAQLRYILSAT